ncbi:MAG: serine/threonine protein kinase, partial [Planctomycetota bacterium]
MGGEPSERVRELFFAVLDHPREERPAFLEEQCANDPQLRAKVELLLAHHEAPGSFLHQPAADRNADPASPAIETIDARPTGKRIGRYRIRRVIASGGMGVVYEAVQDHPHRIVALKVMRHGAASRQAMKRFHHESEILGRLQHPNIAQIHDAGTFEEDQGAQPYFAMELVKGRPLIDYCDSENLATRDRLAIFAKVCDAVQYAHHKGVIHRDLKPDNILIEEGTEALGEPKILDFGVARATGSDIQVTTLQTDIGQLIGTVPYMSPEQVTGNPHELDTRCDVYSLGVVLYELMCGRLPHDLRDKSIPEAARVIREEDPTPLSSVNRIFRGDIETIVAKALEKEKDRRYQSPAELAADIRHYLADEPIVARPPSTFYQIRKFARRNRALVGGVVGMFALLVLGIIGTGIGLIQANAQRAAAQNEADKAAAVSGFLLDMLSAPDPFKKGRDIKVVDLLEPAAEQIEESFAGQPEVQALLFHTIGQTYRNLGLWTEAEAHLGSAIEIRRRVLGADDPATLSSMLALGRLLGARTEFSKAERLEREILASSLRVLGEEHQQTYEVMMALGYVLSEQGKLEEAIDLCETALEGLARTLGKQHDRTMTARNQLALVLWKKGDLAEAERLMRIVLEHTSVAESGGALFKNNLGIILRAQGRSQEAERMHREVLETRRRLLGNE